MINDELRTLKTKYPLEALSCLGRTMCNEGRCYGGPKCWQAHRQTDALINGWKTWPLYGIMPEAGVTITALFNLGHCKLFKYIYLLPCFSAIFTQGKTFCSFLARHNPSKMSLLFKKWICSCRSKFFSSELTPTEKKKQKWLSYFSWKSYDSP